MLLMEKKPRRGRKPTNPETPPGSRSKMPVTARVDPPLAERFDGFVAAYKLKHRLRTDRSAHIEKAMLEYLERQEPLLK